MQQPTHRAATCCSATTASLASLMASYNNISVAEENRLQYEARIGYIESDLNRRRSPSIPCEY